MARAQGKHASHEVAEETRHTILRVAQELFMVYGYRAVTTRQIADACGLTQPALYHYFADKQELYIAMALEELAKTRAALERITRRNEDIEERLRRVGLYLVSSTQHDITPMLHDIRHELTPAARSTLNAAFHESIVGPIASVFEDGLQKGLLHDQQHGGTDPVTAAYLFMSMILNIVTRKRNGTGQVNDGELVKLTVHILLYGLAYPEAGQTRS